ncbi:hypothetical protein IMCC3317_19370 [Kordia antarctica]|uniref:Uncharacterized protein n=1 Tax=Kordia antarctica TaxID=1218801 RepID=A0A7L4ZKW8_9FLAO|nr:hypothetical protein IMCC3317_19370 [Kordia antarctica]
MDISTNLLQQKCISTVNEVVVNSIEAAKKKDNILVKKVFTLESYVLLFDIKILNIKYLHFKSLNQLSKCNFKD